MADGSGEKIIVQIDPALLVHRSSKSRRRTTAGAADGREGGGASRAKKQPATALKRSIIRMIRKHQQEKIKAEMSREAAETAAARAAEKDAAVLANARRMLTMAAPDNDLMIDADGNPDSEFAESMRFLASLSEKTGKCAPNTTQMTGGAVPPSVSAPAPVPPPVPLPAPLPAPPSASPSSTPGFVRHVVPTTTPVNVPFHSANTPHPQPPHQPVVAPSPRTYHVNNTSTIRNHVGAAPIYGALRNGTLPTYRTASAQMAGTSAPSAMPAPTRTVRSPAAPMQQPLSGAQREYIQRLESQIKQASLQKQLDRVNQLYRQIPSAQKPDAQKIDAQKSVVGGKSQGPEFRFVPTQRRTTRRTYHVGKLRSSNKTSVLLPNKTIRAKAMTEQYHARQAPIHEVRKYLIRHGFIQVGSTAPMDVLRRMYETAKMFVGEVRNIEGRNAPA